MMVDRIDITGAGSPGGAVMENSFSLARILGRVFPGRFFVGAPGSVVFGFGVSSLLRLARTAVLLTLFATSFLTVFIATSNATNLPDGRAYELVSPPDKNGGDVMPISARTRAAADGAAVSFASLAAFGDVLGTGVATEYLAVRSTSPEPGTNGWATHAITPPQRSLSYLADIFGLDPLYEGEFSSDLSRGVFRAWSLLSDAPNVSNVENLYVRTDLRTAGAGSYQLLSDASSPVGSNSNPIANVSKPSLAGASADFSQVIFESTYSLTTDATGSGPWLYEWDRGTLRLVGVLPNGTPADSSIAGHGAANFGYTPHTISSDGRKIFFTDQSTGILYMRETDQVTNTRSSVQLNASERTDCADNDPCSGTPEPDPSGAQAAIYADASADGTRVFFTTQEALTDDAPAGSATNLYMYDTSKPASDPHNLTFMSADEHPADGTGDSVAGVIGASDDGHYVYFGATGQIVANGPDLGSGISGIYLWHDGVVLYVGELVNGLADDLSRDIPQSAGFSSVQSRVTADGRHLLFLSSSGVGLTGYDHGTCHLTTGCRELYVYSAANGHLSCASCNPSGAPATTDAESRTRANAGASQTTTALNRAISEDGRRAFFTTSERLVPEDTNGKLDVYEYDVPTGSVRLLSTGKDTADSYFVDASMNGDDAFIVTRQRLVGWDTDSAYDLYDARVRGGFPDPTASPPACAGDACHGAPSVPPSLTTPGSSTLLSIGNLKPASKKVSKSASKPQKLRKALKACKAQHKKAKRKKCEASARRRFGKSGGSK